MLQSVITNCRRNNYQRTLNQYSKAVFPNHGLLSNDLKIPMHNAEAGPELSSALSQNVTQQKSVVSPPQTLLAPPTRRYRNLASSKWSRRWAAGHSSGSFAISPADTSPGEPAPWPQVKGRVVTMPSWRNRDCRGRSGQTLPRLRKEPTRCVPGLQHLIRPLEN